MERSQAFELVLVLALIGLAGLLLYVIASAPQPAQGWEMQGNGSVDYMFTGSDDTLYVFQGNNVTAIRNNGRVAWSLDLSQAGRSSNRLSNGFEKYPVDEADGNLYLCLQGPITNLTFVGNETFDRKKFEAGVASKVIKLTASGKIAWEFPFTAIADVWQYPWDTQPGSDYFLRAKEVIQVRDGRVFLLHDGVEDVLDDSGRLLFTIHDVSSPVAVDESGRMYAARATGIETYAPDGTTLWHTDVGENITGTYDENSRYPPVYRSLPQYTNGTLYVPVDNGTAAIGTDGRVRWVRHLAQGNYIPFDVLPVDARGNAYMMIDGQPGGYTYVVRIDPDGSIDPHVWQYTAGSMTLGTSPLGMIEPGIVARSDGVIYLITNSTLFPVQEINSSESEGQLILNTLTAYDLASGRTLWSFAVPSEDTHWLTLNESNVNQTLWWNPRNAGTINPWTGYDSRNPDGAINLVPVQGHQITINPGKNIVYLGYYSIVFETPVILDRSRAVYVNSLYALDNNGTLLWKQPMDGFVTHAVARNDTFYYSTDSGRIGGNKVNIAAGVALAAAAYVFLRFFALGTVARARTRVESNKNRNDLLRFVNENPGVTAVDISRGIEMNLGTVRYHLFILTANHKIVSHKDDGKFLRYFRNSGTYTPQERSWLSLMRREPMRRVLASLERRPGQSMQQLAKELDMSQTAVHNHISELSARGIVDRSPGDERGYAYMIKEEYRPYVSKTMERL